MTSLMGKRIRRSIKGVSGKQLSELLLFNISHSIPAVYHVFEQGELENLVEEAASHMTGIQVRLETSGWEKGNWYGIWQCMDV